VVKTLTMPADATPVPFAGGRQIALSGLGAAAAVDSPLYAAVTIAGAGLGGALLGWVAADSKQGAIKAAAFAAGLTSVSSGMASWSSQRLLGGSMVVSGLGGMLWAIRDRIKRRGRRR
jgi:hypothetical protein